MPTIAQKIAPFLWFDTQAEEAANFYVGVFRNSRITKVLRNGDAGPGPKGSVLTISFELEGQPFVALNGGPNHLFSPAVSFVVNCQTQEEVDYYWDHLVAGGKPVQCGWLTDRFGLSWQVVPAQFPELLTHPDPATAQRVMQAMMQMVKLDIAVLQKAAQG
jgi:predicted 3-demethylubiquinone-9 3-methyltransferase (glyoxalase superfamily)